MAFISHCGTILLIFIDTPFPYFSSRCCEPLQVLCSDQLYFKRSVWTSCGIIFSKLIVLPKQLKNRPLIIVCPGSWIRSAKTFFNFSSIPTLLTWSLRHEIHRWSQLCLMVAQTFFVVWWKDRPSLLFLSLLFHTRSCYLLSTFFRYFKSGIRKNWKKRRFLPDSWIQGPWWRKRLLGEAFFSCFGNTIQW